MSVHVSSGWISQDAVPSLSNQKRQMSVPPSRWEERARESLGCVGQSMAQIRGVQRSVRTQLQHGPAGEGNWELYITKCNFQKRSSRSGKNNSFRKLTWAWHLFRKKQEMESPLEGHHVRQAGWLQTSRGSSRAPRVTTWSHLSGVRVPSGTGVLGNGLCTEMEEGRNVGVKRMHCACRMSHRGGGALIKGCDERPARSREKRLSRGICQSHSLPERWAVSPHTLMAVHRGELRTAANHQQDGQEPQDLTGL